MITILRTPSSRIALVVLAMTCLVSVAAFFCCDRAGVSDRPNVVCILVDTLRSDHLGAYGYPRATSPRIDALAGEGVRFANAVSQSSWTLPSMISYMSGRYLFSEVPRLPEETVNLPTLFHREGYSTSAFIANSLVGEHEGFSKGFDHFEIREHKTPQWSAEDLNRRLLPWMERDLKPPFFLYLHYMDAHFPYTPPPELTVFDGGYDPIYPAKRERFGRMIRKFPKLRANAEKDIASMRETIDAYDGAVRFLDRQVGAVLDKLQALGLAENTVVVLSADHGEGLWDHPHFRGEVERIAREDPSKDNLTTYFWRDHGFQLYQELIHVPFIIKGPGIARGLVIREGAENVDLIPTLLDLIGYEGGFQGDGRSLAPAIREGGVPLPEKPLLFSHVEGGTCAIQPFTKLKFIAPNAVGEQLGMEKALFDLGADPGEELNRLNALGEIREDIPRALLEHIQDKEKHDYFKNMAGEMDEATRKKMEELGYL